MGQHERIFNKILDSLHLKKYGVEGMCACGAKGLLDTNRMCITCREEWNSGIPLPTEEDYYALHGKPRRRTARV